MHFNLSDCILIYLMDLNLPWIWICHGSNLPWIYSAPSHFLLYCIQAVSIVSSRFCHFLLFHAQINIKWAMPSAILLVLWTIKCVALVLLLSDILEWSALSKKHQLDFQNSYIYTSLHPSSFPDLFLVFFNTPSLANLLAWIIVMATATWNRGVRVHGGAFQFQRNWTDWNPTNCLQKNDYGQFKAQLCHS